VCPLFCSAWGLEWPCPSFSCFAFARISFFLVLLRIPDFRDRDFRIFKPILKKGFESDPDLSDPNPQIPQKRSVTVVTIHAKADKQAKKHKKLQKK
jgi:hypothetical protein